MITIELLRERRACYLEPRDLGCSRDDYPDYNETKDMHERILEWIGEGKTLRQIVANKDIPRCDVLWVFDALFPRDWHLWNWPLWSQAAKDNPYSYSVTGHRYLGWDSANEAYFGGMLAQLGDKADQ